MTNLPNLSGKVALVTGGSRGIGRACALQLAQAGADVAVNYIASEFAARDVAEQVRGFGHRAITVKADISERQDVEAMMEFVQSTYGRLDILVSNAATGGFHSLLTSTDSHFDAAFNTNARALLLLVQAGLPLLKASGGDARVIAISSEGAVRALPSYGLIGASKAALESLVRSLALEAGSLGIKFNAVRAGFVLTDSSRALTETWKQLAESSTVPSPHLTQPPLTPDDVARTVLVLASDLSRATQGQTIVVGSADAPFENSFPKEATQRMSF